MLNMVRHDICRHNYAVERRLVVGFRGQPHYCYRPYYPTARCRSSSSYMVSDEPFPDRSRPMYKWDLTQSPSWDCGQRRTMNHIVDTCPLTKFEGGLSLRVLHEADDDAVIWLESTATDCSTREINNNRQTCITANNKQWFWPTICKSPCCSSLGPDAQASTSQKEIDPVTPTVIGSGHAHSPTRVTYFASRLLAADTADCKSHSSRAADRAMWTFPPIRLHLFRTRVHFMWQCEQGFTSTSAIWCRRVILFGCRSVMSTSIVLCVVTLSWPVCGVVQE